MWPPFLSSNKGDYVHEAAWCLNLIGNMDCLSSTVHILQLNNNYISFQDEQKEKFLIVNDQDIILDCAVYSGLLK